MVRRFSWAIVVACVVCGFGTSLVQGQSDRAESGFCEDCGWYVGAGAYYITPNWSTNPALAKSRVRDGVTETEQTDFNYGPSFAPLIWFGYRGEGRLGFQARAWGFDESESIAMTNDGGGVVINSAAPLGLRNTSTTAGDELTFDSELRVDVADLVATVRGQAGIVTLDWGAGVRYSKIEQEYEHTEDPLANDLVDSVRSIHTFKGVGPTFAFRGTAAFTKRFSGLAELRYSILFGDFEQKAQSEADNVLVASRRSSTDDFVNIAEIELGVEYEWPGGFFLEGALVGQAWPGAGNSANNDVITVLVDPEVADNNADMAFLGFELVGGWRF